MGQIDKAKIASVRMILAGKELPSLRLLDPMIALWEAHPVKNVVDITTTGRLEGVSFIFDDRTHAAYELTQSEEFLLNRLFIDASLNDERIKAMTEEVAMPKVADKPARFILERAVANINRGFRYHTGATTKQDIEHIFEAFKPDAPLLKETRLLIDSWMAHPLWPARSVRMEPRNILAFQLEVGPDKYSRHEVLVSDGMKAEVNVRTKTEDMINHYWQDIPALPPLGRKVRAKVREALLTTIDLLELQIELRTIALTPVLYRFRDPRLAGTKVRCVLVRDGQYLGQIAAQRVDDFELGPFLSRHGISTLSASRVVDDLPPENLLVKAESDFAVLAGNTRGDRGQGLIAALDAEIALSRKQDWGSRAFDEYLIDLERAKIAVKRLNGPAPIFPRGPYMMPDARIIHELRDKMS